MNEPHDTMLARMLVVAYLLGTRSEGAIPKTVDDMMGRGHDGLNWQAFLPLARDILRQVQQSDTHKIDALQMVLIEIATSGNDDPSSAIMFAQEAVKRMGIKR